MSSNQTSGGAVLMAFALGAIAGAAVALLFAPLSGEETREQLAERLRDAKKKATDWAREGRAFVEEQRDAVNAAVERGRAAYEEAKADRL